MVQPSQPFQFLDLLIVPPGDLLYYLMIFAIGQVSIFMALSQRLRKPGTRAARVYTGASIVFVAVWSLLMLGALGALSADLPARALLPPLERFAQVIIMIACGWAFITIDRPDWRRGVSVAALSLTAVVLIGYLWTGLDWLNVYPETAFNRTPTSAAWVFITVALAGLGAAAVLAQLRTVADAPLKALFFAIIAVGFGVTLSAVLNESTLADSDGASRLAFLAACVLVPIIVYRAVVADYEDALADLRTKAEAAKPLVPVVQAVPASTPAQSVPGAERESAQLMKALGLMLDGATPENIPQRVLLAALNSVRGDLGAILVVHDAHYTDLLVGFDRVMNREITGLSLNLDLQPTLANAIERRQQRALYTDRNEDELIDLYARFDVRGTGPVYFQPLIRAKDLLGVLVIALPYARRELVDTEQELLKGIGIIGASLLALSDASREAKIEAESRIIQAMIQGLPPTQVGDDTALRLWESMRDELTAARGEIETLQGEVSRLRQALDGERGRLLETLEETGEHRAVSERIAALSDDVLRAVEARDRLSEQVRDAEAAFASASTEDNAALYQVLIDTLRREIDALTQQRDGLQTQLETMRTPEPADDAGRAALETAEATLAQLADEKARAEAERDQLAERMTSIEAQFAALGIEGGPAGMAQIITQMYEQRSTLQARFDALKAERDSLAAERSALHDLAAKEGERQARMQILQAEIAHLASDREALAKSREKLRVERDDAAARLDALRERQTQMMAELTAYAQELAEAQAESGDLRAEMAALQAARTGLIEERDRRQAEVERLTFEREGLLARLSGDRARVDQLDREGVGALAGMVESVTEQRSQLERELQQARAELAALEDRLELLQMRGGRGGVQVVYRSDQPEMFVSMVEELRTPLTSIVGYVDLVLNESAGILGEMQRKFMRRVSSNLLRLHTMIDDLIQITALDSGRVSLEKRPTDLLGIIEDALMVAAEPLREKGLSVRLRLPDAVPPVLGDSDALAHVIAQLLSNAYLASAQGGEILVRASLEPGEGGGPPRVHVAVEDRGGGIAPEDVGRVFARRFQADVPLIPGLGDTGVGLAIAQALVVAHGGEMWVETEHGVGSTLHFTLPTAPEVQGAAV